MSPEALAEEIPISPYQSALRFLIREALLFLFLFFLAACSGAGQAQSPLLPWRYADLRAIHSAVGINPSQALLAVYARRIQGGLQVRLDMLDQAPQNETDLYLLIDDSAGGGAGLPGGFVPQIPWDKLVQIPASGSIQVLDADFRPVSELSVTVLRNPLLDTISISLSQVRSQELASLTGQIGLNPGTRLQVFSTPAGSNSPGDALPPVSIQGTPPPPAPVLLAFWNTMPGYTPAQSLRRWDGAHTGPLGGRHGLRNLLIASRDYQIPLALLDLKLPASLSALDYLEMFPLIKHMASQGLLILPEAVPPEPGSPLPSLSDWAFAWAAAEGRRVAVSFGLPASPFLYAPLSPGMPGRYSLLFNHLDTPPSDTEIPLQSRLLQSAGQTVFPIPAGITLTQATADGPPLEIRQALVSTALAAYRSAKLGNSPILVLGGDLPTSTWGNPQAASATLRYLSAHPWIKILDANDLISARAAASSPPREQSVTPHPREQALLEHVRAIASSQDGKSSPLGDVLRQYLLSLSNPISPASDSLPELRNQYFGELGSFSAAARWADHPVPLSDCSQDLDLDGKPECILASEETFALFEADSAALTYGFVRDGEGLHQIVAPSSQFITGLSEPSTWRLAAGLNADPAVIPGAMSNPAPYQSHLESGTLTFSTVGITQTYSLSPGEIRISRRSIAPLAARLPLAIDPWQRFEPGWADHYVARSTSQTFTWGFDTGFKVTVAGLPSGTSEQTFLDSRFLIAGPENPNIDYPPGHFLPFPMGLVDIPPTQDLDLTVRWNQ